MTNNECIKKVYADELKEINEILKKNGFITFENMVYILNGKDKPIKKELEKIIFDLDDRGFVGNSADELLEWIGRTIGIIEIINGDI